MSHDLNDVNKLLDSLRDENAALKARIREFDKSIDAEMRDPNGTIWEWANTCNERVKELEKERDEARAYSVNMNAMLDFDGERWLGERWKPLAGNSYGRAAVAFVMLRNVEKERDELKAWKESESVVMNRVLGKLHAIAHHPDHMAPRDLGRNVEDVVSDALDRAKAHAKAAFANEVAAELRAEKAVEDAANYEMDLWRARRDRVRLENINAELAVRIAKLAAVVKACPKFARHTCKITRFSKCLRCATDALAAPPRPPMSEDELKPLPWQNPKYEAEAQKFASGRLESFGDKQKEVIEFAADFAKYMVGRAPSISSECGDYPAPCNHDEPHTSRAPSISEAKSCDQCALKDKIIGDAEFLVRGGDRDYALRVLRGEVQMDAKSLESVTEKL